jgi:hypothetical protein
MVFTNAKGAMNIQSAVYNGACMVHQEKNVLVIYSKSLVELINLKKIKSASLHCGKTSYDKIREEERADSHLSYKKIEIIFPFLFNPLRAKVAFQKNGFSNDTKVHSNSLSYFIDTTVIWSFDVTKPECSPNISLNLFS